MERLRVCDICHVGIGEHICPNCGRACCDKCFNHSRNICVICSEGNLIREDLTEANV